MSDSIAVAKEELANPLYFLEEIHKSDSAAVVSRVLGCPSSDPLEPSVTFLSHGECTLTMIFVEENAAPRCEFSHHTGCRRRPADRVLGALPLTNYLIRILDRTAARRRDRAP